MKGKTVMNKMRNNGISLIELMVCIGIMAIMIIGAGTVLVHNQKGWNQMYNRVHSGIVADGYVCKKAFDGVVRKSSVLVKNPDVGVGGGSLNVFYYSDPSSAAPDVYASFYTTDRKLHVAYGQLDNGGSMLTADRTETLAEDVESVVFSTAGTSAKMILSLDNGSEAITVTTSAILHSE